MEYNQHDYFEYYKAHAKKKHKGKRIWKRHYSVIISKYYDAISKVIIYDMYSLYLSHRTGTLEIVKYKADSTYYDKDGNIRKNRLPVDWIETKRIWKEDYGDISNEDLKKIKNKPLALHFNEHSDGWQYKWDWDRRSSTIRNQIYYYFQAVRANKRRLAKARKNLPHLDYKEKTYKK
jgi:hypothetical protein